MISDQDLAQLLAERPTLRERAKAAARERKLEEKAAIDAKYNYLHGEAITFACRVLGLRVAEVDGLNFIRSSKAKDEPVIEFEVEGFRFKMYWKQVEAGAFTENGDKRIIYDDGYQVEVRLPKAPNFYKIEGLADLGDMLGVVV